MSSRQTSDTHGEPIAPDLERSTDTHAPEDQVRDQSMRVEAREEHVNPNIQMETQSPGLSPDERDSGAQNR